MNSNELSLLIVITMSRTELRAVFAISLCFSLMKITLCLNGIPEVYVANQIETVASRSKGVFEQKSRRLLEVSPSKIADVSLPTERQNGSDSPTLVTEKKLQENIPKSEDEFQELLAKIDKLYADIQIALTQLNKAVNQESNSKRRLQETAPVDNIGETSQSGLSYEDVIRKMDAIIASLPTPAP